MLKYIFFIFRVNNEHLTTNKLASIHFCAPAKVYLEQFKTHFKKVFKTLINIFNSVETETDSLKNIVLACGQSEEISSNIFRILSEETKSHQERLVFKFLFDMFSSLDLILNNKKNRSEKLKSSLVEDLMLKNFQPVSSFELFETFSLKMNCFIECLQFIQNFLRIEKVYYINKKISELNISQDESF